ncbi:MAG: glycosyltransferase [Saprospiraceae bacterium]|nr:glycosyltransferase [Pyrinomonadaceae bacterium]
MQDLSNSNQNFTKRIGRDVIKDLPKVSVIIPAYKVAAFIVETLDSVAAQTFLNYETIVINDGSPDSAEFENVLQPFFEQIIYLKQANKGASTARNTGIEHSRGELLAFLDGDDIWLPGFLESQVKFLETNNYDLVYADAHLFGEPAFAGQNFMQAAPSDGEANFESLLDFRCNILLSSTVARKEAVLNAGRFEPALPRAMDFNLWLKMSHRGSRLGYQKKILLKYRVRLDSISGDSIQRIQRELDSFDRIVEMIDLNREQEDIVRRQRERLRADMEVERGKSFLLQEDFAASKKAFEKANEYRRSKYLYLIISLIKIAPRLLLRVYKGRRKYEIVFIPSTEKKTETEV